MTKPGTKRRILLLTVYYLPSTQALAQMVRDLARELLRRGFEVSLLVPDNTLRERRTITNEDGVHVIRVRSGKLKDAMRLTRGWNEARLSSVLWSGAKDVLGATPCDFIIYFSPTIFFGRLVRRLKGLWRCRSYLVLRDIFPQWALDAGVLRRGLLFDYFRRRELEQYDSADLIGVQSPANRDFFAADPQLRGYRCEVLYNWKQVQPAPVTLTGYRRRWGLVGKIVFVFGGNIGVAQGVENLVRLAAGLRTHSEAHVLIVGSGTERGALEGRVRELQLQNVSIHGPLEQDEYQAMLFEFDVGLVFLDPSLRTHNFPGKLLGYLAAGMPILAALNRGNDLKEIIETTNAGLACHADDEEDIVVKARLLASDPRMRERLGRNSRHLLKDRFSVAVAAEQILLAADLS